MKKFLVTSSVYSHLQSKLEGIGLALTRADIDYYIYPITFGDSGCHTRVCIYHKKRNEIAKARTIINNFR